MKIASSKNLIKKQRGIALLMLVVIAAFALSIFYFSSISISSIRIEDQKQTRLSLKDAKQALIGYAVTHADGNGSGDPGEHGYLPCPYIADATEGKQDTPCGGRHLNSIGYLPWVSLNTEPFRDGGGNCLWYAVSGSYKNHFNSGLINEDTYGMLQVVDSDSNILIGNDPADRVVAIIFSPGVTLDDQRRAYDNDSVCGDDVANIDDYLDAVGLVDNAQLQGVADTVDQFVHATFTSSSDDVPYNDSFVTITRAEIWQAIMNRSDLIDSLSESTEALAECVAEYVNHPDNVDHRYPWPAKTDIDGGDYRDMPDYSDSDPALNGYSGRFPFNMDDSNTAYEAGFLFGAAFSLDDLLDDPVLCANLNLAVSGVANVDLTDEDLEHRKVINNWKDHFFYAVSKDYATVAAPATPCFTGDCVSIAGTPYSAIIFFAGSPYDAQSRDLADKSDVSNYLENNNDDNFPDAGGNSAYSTVDPDPVVSNDIMFCLNTAANPAVVAC